VTAGADDECPVLEEIEAIGEGHPDDSFVIDDARLFASAPPAPMDPAKWPTLLEVFDALRTRHPEHFVTVLGDQVVAVPERARAAVDAHGMRVQEREVTLPTRAKGAVYRARERLAGRR
jgi:hypothetical protein